MHKESGLQAPRHLLGGCDEESAGSGVQAAASCVPSDSTRTHCSSSAHWLSAKSSRSPSGSSRWHSACWAGMPGIPSQCESKARDPAVLTAAVVRADCSCGAQRVGAGCKDMQHTSRGAKLKAQALPYSSISAHTNLFATAHKAWADERLRGPFSVDP